MNRDDLAERCGTSYSGLPRPTRRGRRRRKIVDDGYRSDLAYIHDAGFGEVARQASATLLDLLKRQKFASGLVVELGCGSGILSQCLLRAGYRVLGYDLSPAMIELARRRAPRGEFRTESFVTAKIPKCAAVAAIGEVFCYRFDARGGDRLRQTFDKIYRALEPNGILLFDLAGPGRVSGREPLRRYTEGPDWACLFAAEEDRHRPSLKRTITTFRKVGDLYQRSQEVHRLKLYKPDAILTLLADVGFRTRRLRGYGTFRFPRGWSGFLATKPREKVPGCRSVRRKSLRVDRAAHGGH